jgi:hypothetical protein
MWRTSEWSDAAGHSCCVQAGAFYIPRTTGSPMAEAAVASRTKAVRWADAEGATGLTAEEAVPVAASRAGSREFPWLAGRNGSPRRPAGRGLTDDHEQAGERPAAGPVPDVRVIPPTPESSSADEASTHHGALSRSPSVSSLHAEASESEIHGPHGELIERAPSAAPSVDGSEAQDQPIDEMTRSIGVPRAGLPYMGPLLAKIEADLTARGQTFTEKQQSDLVQRLLANYPYLLGSSAEDNASGLVVPMGSVEILITFDPRRPQSVVRNPGGSYIAPSKQAAPDGSFAAVETINAAYGTGAHVQTRSGQTSATRGRLALTFGVGATPAVLNVVKVGASVSGTANQSNRSSSNVKDAERGKVEDSRVEAKLIAYPEVNISYKIRQQSKTEPVTRWQDLPRVPIPESDEEALLVWVPKPYTESGPADTVTATDDTVGDNRGRLPRNYYASGLTNIPKLFDEILTELRRQGLRLPTGSATREELLQKLWNLNTYLDDAVNDKDGYQITLGDQGRQIATVRMHSRRIHEAGASQVGATSDKGDKGVHLEDVRTAIDGSSGSHTVSNSTTITPLGLEFDLLPNPTGIKGLGLNIGASLAYTKTRTDTLSAGRTGLSVLVPRYTGRTAAYKVQFEHRAAVRVRGGQRTDTAPVLGHGLVRMPVKEAFAHGFAVDQADAIVDSGRRPQDPPDKNVPLHVNEGKGVGMGLVRVSEDTVSRLRTIVKDEVSKHGFLPRKQDDPLDGSHWYSHGSRLQRQIDNRALLEKMISMQGLDSHYDLIHQDGMTFTLRVSSGFAGMDLDIDSVKVTIRADKSTAPKYRRTTDEYHTVNLAMGMDTTGQGTSQSRKLAVGISLRGLYMFLKGAAMGVEYQRTVGAADIVSFLNNRPELLEFPGKVDEFELTSDYKVTLEYQHSGQTGKWGKGRRDPKSSFALRGESAIAHLLPLGTEAGPTIEGAAPADLLDQGLVYFVDTTGLRALARETLTGLTGPAGAADSDIDTFAGTTEVRAHLREILKKEYTTDRLFDTGLFRDTFGALDISGDLHDVQFSGSSGEKFVKGDIKLFLAENRLTDNNSLGITWDQLDVAFGGAAGHAGLNGEADLNRHWQWNTATSSGRTGGKELIQLDFNHVYAFTAKLHLTVSARQEKHAKLAQTGTPKRLVGESLGPRTVMFLLSEPEALKLYADKSVPITDEQLTKALTRWKDGDLTLTGDTVAKILKRWRSDLLARAEELEGLAVWEHGYPALLEQADVFADRLAWMHRMGKEPVRDAQARQGFDKTFDRPVPLEAPRDPFGTVDMSGHADLLGYANGTVDLSDLPDRRLQKAMTDWRNGDLTLSGDVVAKILVRWRTDVPELPEWIDDRNGLIQLLYDLHSKGALPIWQAETRERFAELVPREQRPLPRPNTPIEHIELPEYLRREDPGGRILGHSGIQTYQHNGGRTTYQLVKDQIEEVAPGMLAAGAEIWNRKGQVVGRMQGSVDALQAMLAKGRDVGMFEEFLSTNGQSFYLVNPVGWLLTDVVEVNISSVLTSAPKISEFEPNTGIEVYGHGYQSASTSKSKDGSQALTFAKFGAGGQNAPTASGAGAAKMSEGHHRGTTRAEVGVTQQTAYDWSGHYLVGFDEAMTIKVQRLKMSGRPLNNLLLSTFDGLTRHGKTVEPLSVPGRLEIQVPRSIAVAGVAHDLSPWRNLAPLPKLPGNAFIAGTMIDDSLPIARKMLAQVFKPGAVARMFGAEAGDLSKESSRSLPVVLSRLHLTNHLREATGGDTYQVAKGIIMPGDADVRADLYLKGDLYDLEVIAQMKEGTGTGRYNKHQSGTTAFAGTDHVRLEGDYQIDGSGHVGHHHPDQAAHTWDLQDSGSRVTSLNQNSAGTENYRREQHAKEQGPVYMVRLRFRGRFHADKFQHHLFRKPTFKGRFHSDPISGDVYAELPEAEVNELRAQLEQSLKEARPPADTWPVMRDAPAFDLAPLLADAARARLDPSRMYQHVARYLRTQLGADRPLVLTADQAALTRGIYWSVLRWAVPTMHADLQAARTKRSDLAAPDSLGRYERYVNNPRNPASEPRDLDKAIAEIINAVNDLHALRTDSRAGAPAELPAEVAAWSVDPVYVARDVAHDLHAHIRVDVRRPDGMVRSTWLDPNGGVHAFDPMATDVDEAGRLWVEVPTGGEGRPAPRIFTAELAYEHGLLSDWYRTEIMAFALDRAELGRLYQNAIARQQTFEQAAAEEIALRRARLEAVHPGLSERVRQAYAAHEFWRNDLEWRRAEERAIRDPIEADVTALAARLEEVRETPDDTERERWTLKTLDRLRTAARSDAPEPMSPADGQRIGARLDDLTSLGRLLEAARVRGTDRPTVPEGLALTDAYLSVNADARAVLHRRDEKSSIGPARPLAEYAPVFWITHGAPDAGVTLEDIVGTGWTDALEFLAADRGVSLTQRVHQTLRKRPDRLIETSDELPHRLPAGTWVAFDGGTANGAAVARAEGGYRTYIPGTEIKNLPAEKVRKRAGEQPRFVIAKPEDQLPLELPPPRSGSEPEPPHDRDEEHESIQIDDPPPADPHLYRNRSGNHRVSERGLAQNGWHHVGALSEFAPLSWLVRRRTASQVTALDVMRNDLFSAARFFAHADLTRGRADAVRAYLEEEPGRDVEVTPRLPESLPTDTLVWFTGGADQTGAGYLHPDGKWRIFAPGVTLQSEDGRRHLSGGSRTFVVSRPAADGDATRPAPLERDAEPLTPDAGPLATDDAARPVPAHPIDRAFDATSSAGEEERSRLHAVQRTWTGGQAGDETVRSLRRLRDQLERAGSGALALVTLQDPDQRFVAFNQQGRIQWSEYPSGRTVRPSTDAGAGAFVALGPGGVVLDPPTEPASDRLSFPRLYAAFVALLSGWGSARVAPRSPAAGERPRPARPFLFLEEPRPGLGDGGRAVPQIAERRPLPADSSGLKWVKSSSSTDDCVEVAAVWR